MSIYQFGRAGPSNWLPLHRWGDVFPSPSEVSNATSGGEWQIKGPAQPSRVVQNHHALVRSYKRDYVQAFPSTLEGLARVWFSKLTSNTCLTFKELSGHFVTHLIEGKRHRRSSMAILSITQQEEEILRSYVTRFNKKALLIDEVYNKVLVTAFIWRLWLGEFLFSLYKNDLKTMAKTPWMRRLPRGTGQGRDKGKMSFI